MNESVVSEETFFFHLSPGLLIIADLNGYFKRVSAAFAKTLGYSEFDLLADPLTEFIHPDDRAATLSALERLKANDSALSAESFEHRYRAKDGSYRWLSWAMTLQSDRDVIYGVAHDITQQKQAEAELRANVERWKLALKGSNDGVWDWNVQTNEVFFSTRWKTMLGYEEHEISNHVDEWAKRVHPDDIGWVTQVVQDHFDRKTPFYVSEHRVQCKDGTYKWILDRGQAIWDEAGNVLRMVGSHTDVTEHREMEAALKRTNEELEQRVAERTIQLEQANAALRESEDRNQLAMEVARMFSFEWDPITDVVKRSAQCGPILGLTEAAIEKDTGVNFFQRIHPEDREHFQSVMRALSPENNAYRAIYRVIRPDDQIVILEENGRALFNGQRQFIRLIGMAVDITDRHRLEADLEASQAILQRQLAEIEGIYQSAPIGLNFLDPDLRFVRINQRLADINGLPIEAHIGKTIRELLPDLADVAEQLLRPIFETGEPRLNVEVVGETPAQPGVQRVWRESFWPLKDGDRVIGINTVCEEITEHKRTGQRLRESEERLRLGMQVAGFALAKVDYATHQVELSPEAARLYGLPDDQLIILREQLHATFHPDDRAELLQMIQQSLDPAGAGWFAADHRVVWKNGDVKWLTVRKQVFFDRSSESPKPVYAILAAVDITYRKQAEEALRESEDRLRMAIASAQLGIWDWNLLTGELKWDAGCKALFGLSLDAEVNIDLFFAAVHPDDRDRLQTIVQAVLDPASGGFYDAEYRVISFEDKAELWLRSKGQVYYDATEKPVRFSGTVLEITERKQAEVQREQLLHQEQAAREAAEQANRIKDEFLAILSHELRTPLNPILGWAKLLQSPQISPEKLQQGLMTIERNAKQQAQLVDDLLDISRIIRGKIALTFETVALSEPIFAALETVRLAAEAKAIQLEVILDPTVGPVKGDSGRLQQVVWNLLSNAIKFTPNGGHIELRLEQVQKDRTHTQENDRGNASSAIETDVRITVTDTGKGIQPQFLPHVFELFRQQDSSTTRSFGGLGLGLAIARQVVEAHGGTITATSAGEGQGATFTVQLPLMPVSRPDTPGFLKHSLLNFENLRVVAVDDEIDSLELIRILLEQAGATVQAVSLATDALQLLAQAKFDVLVSDIGMPEMDGYDFIRQVRLLPPEQNRDIPAIALTAYAGETNRRQLLGAGFQVHLAKPIDPQNLLDAIAAIIAP